jgi:predicted DNA binding protein
MWTAKLRIKHDCVIGSRCKKFGVTTLGTPFNVYTQGTTTYSPQVQTIYGDKKSVENFISDLRGEKRLSNLEHEGNTVFFIEKRKEKIPASYYHSKLFFVKPVYVDKEGYEFWEVASWDRKIITEFIKKIKSGVGSAEILRIKDAKITDIYFSHLMPRLTEKQKNAILLALEKGWYKYPRKTDLGRLAKMMGVSIPTFREHLKRAEEKIMPELVRST